MYAVLGIGFAAAVIGNHLPGALQHQMLVDIVTDRISTVLGYILPAIGILEAAIWFVAYRRFTRSELILPKGE